MNNVTQPFTRIMNSATMEFIHRQRQFGTHTQFDIFQINYSTKIELFTQIYGMDECGVEFYMMHNK